MPARQALHRHGQHPRRFTVRLCVLFAGQRPHPEERHGSRHPHQWCVSVRPPSGCRRVRGELKTSRVRLYPNPCRPPKPREGHSRVYPPTTPSGLVNLHQEKTRTAGPCVVFDSNTATCMKSIRMAPLFRSRPSGFLSAFVGFEGLLRITYKMDEFGSKSGRRMWLSSACIVGENSWKTACYENGQRLAWWERAGHSFLGHA